jgi:hypothetical protein
MGQLLIFEEMEVNLRREIPDDLFNIISMFIA